MNTDLLASTVVVTCNDCIEAYLRVWHGFSDCPGCKARAVARDPRFFAARKAGRITPEYRRMLEQVEVTHEDVKAAAAADKLGAKGTQERTTK